MNRATTDKHRQMGALDAEQARRWVLGELVDHYGYDEELLQRRGKSGQLLGEHGCTLLFFDLVSADGSAFLSIVAAAEGEAEAAEAALRRRLLEQPHTAVGVCSDGTEAGTRTLRRSLGSDRLEYIGGPHRWRGRAEASQWYLNTHEADGAATLAALDERLEPLFFVLYSHFRDIDGLHAPEALDELCKVLLAWSWDERSTPAGEPYRLQRARYGCTEELGVAVRELYATAPRRAVADAFEQPITLSDEAIERAVSTLAGHSLLRSSADVKGRAFQRVMAASSRAGMGQYFTPTEIIELMVACVAPAEGERVIDPFAGSAHFLRCAARHMSPGESDEPALFGLEKSERMLRVAWTDTRLSGEERIALRHTDSLLDFANWDDLDAASFDVVLTNPPFGSVLGRSAYQRLADFELARGQSSVPMEVLGLERSVQLLRPGGRFGVVLPEGILANKSTRYVRDWLREHVKLRAILGLPVEAFSPFGASVKTSIVFGRKRRVGEQLSEDDAVFLGRADSVGYDSSGTRRADSELGALGAAVRGFLDREGW